MQISFFQAVCSTARSSEKVQAKDFKKDPGKRQIPYEYRAKAEKAGSAEVLKRWTDRIHGMRRADFTNVRLLSGKRAEYR